MNNAKEQSEVVYDKEILPTEHIPVSQKKNVTTSKNKAKKKVKNKKSNSRPFPADTLESALKIPQTIRENNAGNPWKPVEVAKSLGMAPKANKFFYYTASSKLYGLTIGTRDSLKIELASIGKRIFFAKSEEEKLSAHRDAFLNVSLFKNVYDYYKGGDLPKLEFLRNTLIEEFKLSESYISEFYKIYQENVNFLKKIGAFNIEENSNFTKTSSDINSENAVSYGNSSNKLNVFIAIPFSEKTEIYPKGFFDEVIMQLITPAANEAGFNVKTAKRHGSDLIHATIIKELMSADLVIADLTEHNPNVLFEIGWRIANKKPIALIRTNKTQPIFDVDNVLRVFEYNANLWKSTLSKDIPALAQHITETWKSKASKTYADIFLEA